MKDRKVLEILQSKDDTIQELQQVRCRLCGCEGRGIFRGIKHFCYHRNIIRISIYKEMYFNIVVDVVL